jgi:hypothetical protein
MKLNSQGTSYVNLKIDHVLINVNNLDSAKKAYENYGFTVVYGGSPTKALNALIFLRDGTVIELIGKDRLPYLYTLLNKLRITKLFGIMKDRIASFKNAPVGLFNYCLYTENLNSTYKYLKQKGLKVSSPISLSRLREDKIKINWNLVGSFPYDLPFFIENYSPSRLSDVIYTVHKNKAIALDSLVIETTSFDKYYNNYNIIYNQVPKIHLNNNIRRSTYKLTDQAIILQETTIIRSVFTKKDQSIPIRFFVKCDSNSDVKSYKVNEFITLTAK